MFQTLVKVIYSTKVQKCCDFLEITCPLHFCVKPRIEPWLWNMKLPFLCFMKTLPQTGKRTINGHCQHNVHELSMNTVALLLYSDTTGIWDSNKVKDATKWIKHLICSIFAWSVLHLLMIKYMVRLLPWSQREHAIRAVQGNKNERLRYFNNLSTCHLSSSNSKFKDITSQTSES